jgi:hypothetical protein
MARAGARQAFAEFKDFSSAESKAAGQKALDTDTRFIVFNQ